MRKVILVLAAGLSTASTAVPQESQPVPKEGTFSGTGIGTLTIKVLPQGKERLATTWEFLGAIVSDDPRSLTHNSSVRCLGSVHIVNGAYEEFTNACTFTRPDGDQVFTIEKGTGKIGMSSGTSSIVGGTGKLVGIRGGYEWTRYNVRPAADGTLQSVTKAKGSYKLP